MWYLIWDNILFYFVCRIRIFIIIKFNKWYVKFDVKIYEIVNKIMYV